MNDKAATGYKAHARGVMSVREKLPLWCTKLVFARKLRVQYSLGCAPTGPCDIDFHPATCTQARDTSVDPCLGQRRQNIDFPLMAMQKHLRDRGRTAEVAVDLKNPSFSGGVRVE